MRFRRRVRDPRRSTRRANTSGAIVLVCQWESRPCPRRSARQRFFLHRAPGGPSEGLGGRQLPSLRQAYSRGTVSLDPMSPDRTPHNP
ncbi:Hypothetical protein NTJ_10783 [Nesidiocoris tenuis]|uniref:Uncharacterized protein n=1 Tax=Nesidiocoris tenuis TaxID=355587 RepID=A0ABN7B158_9HEMI|nr:Hypothetical protein NTJ_10783 [Nesidiocoris tenuis]